MAVNSMLCAYVELSLGIVVMNFMENRSYVLKTEVPVKHAPFDLQMLTLS